MLLHYIKSVSYILSHNMLINNIFMCARPPSPLSTSIRARSVATNRWTLSSAAEELVLLMAAK